MFARVFFLFSHNGSFMFFAIKKRLWFTENVEWKIHSNRCQRHYVHGIELCVGNDVTKCFRSHATYTFSVERVKQFAKDERTEWTETCMMEISVISCHIWISTKNVCLYAWEGESELERKQELEWARTRARARVKKSKKEKKNDKDSKKSVIE